MVEIEKLVISVIQIEGRESCCSRHISALNVESICGLKHLSQCFPFLAFICTQKDDDILMRQRYSKLFSILFINFSLFIPY